MLAWHQMDLGGSVVRDWVFAVVSRSVEIVASNTVRLLVERAVVPCVAILAFLFLVGFFA